MGPYSLIMADPPWMTTAGGKRNVKYIYNRMTTNRIMVYLDIMNIKIAENCLLALWKLGCMPQDALDVCSAWNFNPKAELIWKKQTVHGKRHFGMGAYVRSEHETCILATRGSVKVLDKSIRSTFTAKYRGHSRKPDEIYEILERLYHGPRLELFATHRREGWDQIGDQLPLHDR